MTKPWRYGVTQPPVGSDWYLSLAGQSKLKRATSRRRRRIGWVIALAALTAGLSLVAISGATSSPSSVIGVYPGSADPAGITPVNTLLGYKVQYAMGFVSPQSWATISDPSQLLSSWEGSGYDMTFSVPLLPTGTTSDEGAPVKGTSLAIGATGIYDAYFEALAHNLVAAGYGSSIIRLGWEFNNSAMAWFAGGKTAAFVSYWRQAVDTMRAVSGADFSFEWDPELGNLGVGNLASFYPGNQFVNIVGLDVFDEATGSYPGATAEWHTILTGSYGLDWLASFGTEQAKPLALPEWGLGTTSGRTVGGGDDPYFVQQTAAWIAKNDVNNVIAWDAGANPLPSATDPLSEAAFVSAFSSSGADTTTTTDPPTTTSTTTTTDLPTTTTTSTTATSTTTSTTTTTAPTTTTTTAPTTTTTTTTTAPTTTTTTTTAPSGASCTDPTFSTSNAEDTDNTDPNDGYQYWWVNNDAWNGGAGPQTLYVCNQSSWYVTSDQPNIDGEVETYPDTEYDVGGRDSPSTTPISGWSSITSTFSEDYPSAGSWDAAYDLWTDDWTNETMIWNQWTGTDDYWGDCAEPGSDQNDCVGQGGASSDSQAVTLDGVAYHFLALGSDCDAANEANCEYIFFRDDQVSSGSVDILAAWQWEVANGYANADDVPTQLEYGVEICSTSGTETFPMDGLTFSLSQ